MTQTMSETNSGSTISFAAPTNTELAHLLQGLYQKQIELDPSNGYLVEHSKAKFILNQIRTFHWYRPYLETGHSVLDWGCNHAPDSCLMRAWFQDRLNLFSCDFVGPERYSVFHDYARTEFRQLVEPIQIPFAPQSFDVVIASGVLEHTAMDYESLKELHRILKHDGILAISYLPNWLSPSEWYLRNIKKKNFHRRLYRKGEITRLLKRTGFYPLDVRYHTFIWERFFSALGFRRREAQLANFARKFASNFLASTLCVIARRVHVM